MDRRALAARNKMPQVNNGLPGKPRHVAGLTNSNNFNSKQNSNAPQHSSGNRLNDGSKVAQLPLPTRACIVCRNQAVCVCQRCGDFYCSPICQRKDWAKHRYICFPMPPLVEPTATLTTDAVYIKETPLLTAARISNQPLENQQRILDDIFKANDEGSNQQQQKQQNNRQHQTELNEQQEKVANHNNKTTQMGNKMQKGKEPTATLKQAIIPKPNSRVMLTGFRTPNRCYVRPLTPAEDEDYLLNARKIDNYGKKAPPLSKLPKIHSYAIAPLDGIMYRVEVLMARNAACIRVLFCDRGIIANRRLNELREITDDIIRLQQHAALVPLRNVSNYALKDNVMEYLAALEDLELKIKYERVEDGVELLHWQTERCLNDEIEAHCKKMGAEVYTDTTNRTRDNAEKNNKNTNQAGKCTAIDAAHDEDFYVKSPSAQNSTINSQTSQNQLHEKQDQQKQVDIKRKEANEKLKLNVEDLEQPIMNPPFETHYFKKNCAPFKAIVLDVSCLEYGYIGCIAAESLPCLQKVHKQLTSLDVPEKPYKPKLEEYCIAKFEDMWYRAQVTDIPDETHYTVMYIDFTNEATLTSADIRRYPASVTDACKTNLCLIDGLPSEFSAELIRFLKEEIDMQSEIKIDSVNKIDEQVVVVECHSLLEKIRQKNLF